MVLLLLCNLCGNNSHETNAACFYLHYLYCAL